MNKLVFSFLMLFSINAVAVDYFVVTADSVRVRSAPNLNGTSLVMLNKGHLVIKDKEQNGWTKIHFTGRDKETGHTEGWMSSRYLAAEKKVIAKATKKEFQLTDNGASLSCEQVMGSDFIQGCDLHLQYGLVQGEALKKINVNCSAELVAKTKSGELIPVPVNQTLEHFVLLPDEGFSMHILMKADLSYELTEVNLEGHRCQLASYSK